MRIHNDDDDSQDGRITLDNLLGEGTTKHNLLVFVKKRRWTKADFMKSSCLYEDFTCTRVATCGFE